jgi:hypothetical protein
MITEKDLNLKGKLYVFSYRWIFSNWPFFCNTDIIWVSTDMLKTSPTIEPII